MAFEKVVLMSATSGKSVKARGNKTNSQFVAKRLRQQTACNDALQLDFQVHI